MWRFGSLSVTHFSYNLRLCCGRRLGTFVVAMYRVDVVELVVDLVDVNLDIDLVDVDLDVDLVDVDLVDILFESLLGS